MSEQSDQQAATKADLQEAIQELREWIFDREVKAIRFFVLVGLAYYSITMGGVWFMVNAQIHEIRTKVEAKQ